jgi:ABC-type sugar transport system ATPase subunit
VRIDGAEVTDHPPGDRSVAMVFQDLALFPHLTVAQNIGFGARARGETGPDVARATADAARTLDIAGLLDRRPHELSGGERQRVALARALLRQPSLFLLDEPLSSVDAELRVRLREQIKDLQRRTGVAMVHVTHDQTEAMALADRVVVMRAGRVEQAGTPVELWDRPATVFVARLLADVPLNLLPAAAVGESGDHVVGVRADALRLAPAGCGTVAVQVQDVVLDGGAAVVRLASDVGTLHARMPWDQRPEQGERLTAGWEPARVHRFAVGTGERLP